MSQRKRAGSRSVRGGRHSELSTQPRPSVPNLGTLDSDDDMPLTPQNVMKTIEDADYVPQTAGPSKSPVKLIPEKTADKDRLVLEYLRGISLRQMAIEEKIDNLQKTVEMIYRSIPSTPSSGPRSGVVTMTHW